MTRGRKVNRKGRNDGEGQYFALPYCLIQSEVWRSLSGNSLKLFLELRAQYNGNNNGKLILSYEQASERLGIGKSTVKRAFDELLEKGFIKRHKQGMWMGRMAHEWEVTDKPCNGNPATKDWQKWQSNKPIRQRKIKRTSSNGTYRSPIRPVSELHH